MSQAKNNKDNSSTNERHVNRFVNLKSKNELEIVKYDLQIETIENYEIQLKKLNLELQEMLKKYYSNNATVERIQERDLMCIIKTVVYRHKKNISNKT